jgi:Spy/CpxP family protein refolding chaperone
MSRLIAWSFAVLVFLALPDRAVAHDRGRQNPREQPKADRPSEGQRDRWKWWLYDRAELSITDKQSADIDMIFETTVPGQRARREELERLEAALAVIVKENRADVSAVAQQVEKVENVRAELNKTRTVMLYQINRLLTAEQRVKLEKLRARRDAERGKNDHRR